MKRKGRKSAAQTPSPAKERIYGSSKNPKGSAASKSAASKISLSEGIVDTLKDKAESFEDKYPSKDVSVNTLKAVMRRGMGAYSKSHRPTITGGQPNSRQAWGFARVNKFLEKKAGKPVKKAYVQDDDLLENGGFLHSIQQGMDNLIKNGIVLTDKAKYITLIAYNTGNQEINKSLYNKSLIYYSVKPLRQANEIIERLDNGEYSRFDVKKVEEYKNAAHLIIVNQNEVVYDSKNPNTRYKVGGEVKEEIALPDTTSTYDKLKPILENQGYELNKIKMEDNILEFNKGGLNLIPEKDSNIETYYIKNPILFPFNNMGLINDLVKSFNKKYTLVKFLGSGANGSAYLTSNKTVLKITVNEQEAYGSFLIYKNPEKFTTQVKIYDLFVIQDIVKKDESLSIKKGTWQEIKPLPTHGKTFFIEKEYIEPLNLVSDFEEDYFYLSISSSHDKITLRDLIKRIDKIGREEYGITINEDDIDKIKKLYHFGKILHKEGKYYGIDFSDLSVDNFGYDKNKNILCYDCINETSFRLKNGGYIFKNFDYFAKVKAEMGMSVLKPEVPVDKIAEDQGVSVSKVKEELKQGTKVESEHTNVEKAARAVASQHLQERIDYYDKLDQLEKSPIKKDSGGYIVSEKAGKEIAHNDADMGGILVGRRHSQGGIKGKNKGTNQHIEVEGGEIVVSSKAVGASDSHTFNGKAMGNREILSFLNTEGGGVAFKAGGETDKPIEYEGGEVILTRGVLKNPKKYAFNGRMMTSKEIASAINEKHTGVSFDEGGDVPEAQVEVRYDKVSDVHSLVDYLFDAYDLKTLPVYLRTLILHSKLVGMEVPHITKRGGAVHNNVVYGIYDYIEMHDGRIVDYFISDFLPASSGFNHFGEYKQLPLLTEGEVRELLEAHLIKDIKLIEFYCTKYGK